MGAWGHEIFDNDYSCDIVHRYLDTKSPDEFYTLLTKEIEDMQTMSYLEVDDAGSLTVIGYLIGRLNGDTMEFANVKEYWSEKLDPVIAASKPQYKKWNDEAKFEGSSANATIIKLFEKVLLNGEVSEAYELWGETDSFQSWFDYTKKFLTYFESLN